MELLGLTHCKERRGNIGRVSHSDVHMTSRLGGAATIHDLQLQHVAIVHFSIKAASQDKQCGLCSNPIEALSTGIMRFWDWGGDF